MTLPNFPTITVGGYWEGEPWIFDYTAPLRIGYKQGHIEATRRARISGKWGNLRFTQVATWERYMLYMLELAEMQVPCKWLEEEALRGD